MTTLYARREPTTDDTAIKMLKDSPRELEGLKDICLYSDKSCTDFKALIPWHYKGKPRKRTKFVRLNCFRYAVEWAAPLEYTRVIFRRSKDDEIFALFPDLSEGGALIESYQHVGQHSAADYSHCIQTSTPAKPDEYADLKAELECIGYNLLIRKRR